MELKIVNGDFVPDGKGGFEAVSGAELTLQRALHRLRCPLGAFPFLPQYGSLLHQIMRTPKSRREQQALSWAAQALAEEEQVQVTAVQLEYTAEDKARLKVTLQYQDDDYELKLEVK